MGNIVQIKRRMSGAAGSPSSLKSGELSHNEVDGLFYVGCGDDGAGNATGIKPFAKDDFSTAYRVPAGGATGYILTKSATSDYSFSWQAAPVSQAYTASTGILLNSNAFSVDTSLVALLASPALTGTPSAPTAMAGTSTSQIATTSFVAQGLSGKAATVHTHSASDITSGVLDVARIPVLPSQSVQVSSGDLTALTTAQQNAIVMGEIVTTQDGSRYVYSGSGDKTLAASYIILADVTPPWEAISNKPSFATVATTGKYSDLIGSPALATVATTGSYTDLLNKPSLGTVASQNANAVAFTGGTIAGVTLSNASIDAGTF